MFPTMQVVKSKSGPGQTLRNALWSSKSTPGEVSEKQRKGMKEKERKEKNENERKGKERKGKERKGEEIIEQE